MKVIILGIHVLACLLIIFIVLIQKGKGAELGVAFGSSSSQALFGPGSTTSFLHRLTTILAVIFMITSIALTMMSGKVKKGSVMEDVTKNAPITQSAEKPSPSKGGGQK
ncbi:MAG TPA: preprotein translocase subunit SecG [Desulfobacteraceae bacterium]|nr:preprotein translocase subunit SecG [Desulfobacteraceae bacterium]